MPQSVHVDRTASIVGLVDTGNGQIAVKRLHKLLRYVQQWFVGARQGVVLAEGKGFAAFRRAFRQPLPEVFGQIGPQGDFRGRDSESASFVHSQGFNNKYHEKPRTL